MIILHQHVYKEYPLLGKCGKPNFAGVLELNHTITIAKYKEHSVIQDWWKNETKTTYMREYNQKLLKHIPLDLALRDCEFDHFEQAINEMQLKYKFGESQKNRYKRLILYVFNSALATGIVTNDIFWGTGWRDCEGDEEGNEKSEDKKSIAIKSFTQEEEQAFLMLLCANPIQCIGEVIGLLLMLILGLRNHEAAALKYGDIVNLETAKKQYCIRINQSATKHRNVLQGSGKTENAVRVLPIPFLLYLMLMKRLEYVVRQIELQPEQYGLPKEFDKLKLPICCFGHQYSDFSLTRDLTKVGKEYLRLINFDQNQFARIQRGIERGEITDVDGNEDRDDDFDATTYLLRHNAATRLFVTGLFDSEIQYPIGHKLEDPDVKRKDYANDDFQVILVQKIEQHPFYKLLDRLLTPIVSDVEEKEIKTDEKTNESVSEIQLEEARIENTEREDPAMTKDCTEPEDDNPDMVNHGFARSVNKSSSRFVFRAGSQKSLIRVRIEMREPGDKIRIQKSKGIKILSAMEYKGKAGYPEEVNIISIVTKRYLESEEKAKRMVQRILEAQKEIKKSFPFD